MQIQNNLAAKNTSRNQGITRGKLDKTLERLSSGYKINRAGDNAAGLALSENMRAQIRGLDQAMKNANDGIGMTNTGDGALEEVHAMLGRMKTLAVQAANGTYNSIARASLDAERLELMDEIDRISETTNFDDIPLFAELPKPKPAWYTEPPTKPDGEDGNIPLQIGPAARETMDVERYYMGSEALNLEKTSFLSVNDANESVEIIDTAILAVSRVRSSYGSSKSHLDHTIGYLSVTEENMTAAESQIRDTDMADMFTTYTKENILLQASNSVLAHANSLPQTVLQLIQG